MNSQSNPVVAETSSQELETLRARARDLKAVEKSLKEAQRLAQWEADVTAVNPQYQVGSVRRPTAEEVSSLGHSHGQVCEIRCQECQEIRVVNLQDARQCRFCKACKATANKAKAKVSRTTKRLAGQSVSDLERQIAEAQAQLDTLTANAKVA